MKQDIDFILEGWVYKPGVVQARLVEARDGRQIIQMRVARMPKAVLTVDDLEAELEVDEDYHLVILEWAAYRALRNHDTDVENIGKATSHKNRFNEVVAEAEEDSRRAMFAPVEFIFNSRW